MRECKVEAARTVAYAAATNDDHPRHANGELAPPVFAVVPVWEAMTEAVGRITPPEVLMRVVHASQDMRFHQPLVPGDLICSRAAPLGVTVRGTGTTLLVRTESRHCGIGGHTRTSGDGEMVNEQYVTMFFRGASEGESGGQEPPSHKLSAATKAGGPVAEVAQPVDADQTFRYADASGDRLAIHLDEGIARSVGFPGIIVHGLCTMAFA
ncbi:MAG: MaoC/PaaZ C-terminal domain-containing protein, partial [Acidimicrobiia bacterium]